MSIKASIIAMLIVMSSVTACYQESGKSSSGEKSPPKPPNCPDLPEVRNLRMKSGRLADVRILQSDEFKYYIPTSWLRSSFIDRYRHLHHMDPKHGDYYWPQLNEVECPGVVHRHVGKEQPFGFMTPKIDRIHNFAPSNISSDSALDSISFGRMPAPDPRMPDPYKDRNSDRISQWNPRNSLDFPRAIIVLKKDKLTAIYDLRRDEYLNSPRWISYRNVAIALNSWLLTPPRERDNNQIFQLGDPKQ